jgi:hypothetical protein
VRRVNANFTELYGRTVSVKDYGAVGDGVTDDTAAIQAAIDAAIYNGSSNQASGLKQIVVIPAGIYKTGDTIHLGYGITFNSIIVEGAGYKYRASNNFNGTVIVPTFSDRPAFNFQGSRGSVLRGVAIEGLLDTYIDANNMGSDTAPVIDDTVAANWNDGALHANQDSRYAPYAAISIDAYSGTRPATSYPDVVYPSFLGAVAQYGKAYSSDVLIEDVYIEGFTVGIVNQPCDADANGDFTTIRRLYLEKCKWGISVGNSQSRNVHIDCMKASRVYSVLTNNQHGKQLGKFGGAVIDMSIFGAINLFIFGGYYAMPVVFTNLYAESLWKIGTQSATSSNEHGLLFQGCEFKFTAQTDERGVPAAVLDGGVNTGAIAFDECHFNGYPSVAGFFYIGLGFRGCFFRIDTRTNPYEQFAHNATGGGLVAYQLKNPTYSDLKVRFFNLDTGAAEATTKRTARWDSGSRKNCIPWYAMNVGAASETYDSFPNKNSYFLGVIAKSSLSSISLSGKTLTCTFSSRSDAAFMLNGPLPGDVVWDDATGMTFFVRSRTTTTFIAEAQNNYKYTGGVYVPIVAFSTISGNLYFRNSRIYTPPYYLRGDTTSGNATIANVARDDDFAAWFDAEITAGDAFAINGTQDNWLSAAAPFISARDQAVPSITLTATTGLRTQTRKRFDMFVRLPPANI